MFIKKFFNSKVARNLILTNIVLWAVALYIRRKGGAHDFHFIYEPILVQILLVLNLPALLFAGVLLIPLVYFGLGVTPNETNSWYEYFLALLCASLQWGLIGCLIEKILSRQNKANNIILK